MNIKSIVKSLVKGKKSIFDSQVKVANRKFQLGGVGNNALKVKMNPPKGFPHLDVSGFLNWDKFDEFTPQEKELIKSFYDKLE